MVGNNNAFNSSGEDIHISACSYNSTEGDFFGKRFLISLGKGFWFFPNPGPSQENDSFQRDEYRDNSSTRAGALKNLLVPNDFPVKASIKMVQLKKRTKEQAMMEMKQVSVWVSTQSSHGNYYFFSSGSRSDPRTESQGHELSLGQTYDSHDLPGAQILTI